MTENELSRFKRCLAAYGTRLDLWPDAAGAEALRLRDKSAEARLLWNEAAALDGRLDAEPPLAPSARLSAAVLASAPATRRPWTFTLWPFGPAWQPATGLAAAAMLGLFLGLSMPADDVMASTFPGASDLIWEADEWETF
jgi:hypothetical protein